MSYLILYPLAVTVLAGYFMHKEQLYFKSFYVINTKPMWIFKFGGNVPKKSVKYWPSEVWTVWKAKSFCSSENWSLVLRQAKLLNK